MIFLFEAVILLGALASCLISFWVVLAPYLLSG